MDVSILVLNHTSVNTITDKAFTDGSTLKTHGDVSILVLNHRSVNTITDKSITRDSKEDCQDIQNVDPNNNKPYRDLALRGFN